MRAFTRTSANTAIGTILLAYLEDTVYLCMQKKVVVQQLLARGIIAYTGWTDRPIDR